MSVTIFTRRIDSESIAAELLKKIKSGDSVEVDNLDVLDELIFSEELPIDVKFQSLSSNYISGLKTAKDMRRSGYNIL